MKLNEFIKKNKAVFYGALAALFIAAAVIVLILIKNCGAAGAKDAHSTPAPDVSGGIEPTYCEVPSLPSPIGTADEDPVITQDPSSPAPTGLLPVFGMVASAKNISYGVSTTGLVSYTGKTNLRAECYSWRDITRLDASEKLTAAVDSSGKVHIAGSPALNKTASAWSGAKEICCTSDAVYALLDGGKVVGTDGRSYSGAVCIAANDNDVFVFGENSVIYSPFGGINTSDGIVAASASNTHAVIVSKALTLHSSRANDPFEGCAAACAFAGENCTAYIDGAGALHTDCEYVVNAIESGALLSGCVESVGGVKIASVADCAHFSCRGGHSLVLFESGFVFGCGDNAYLQNDVSSWRLRPYSSEGCVYGIAPASGIKTGQEYTAPNGVSGTAIVLGDIDMDGEITRADHTLLVNFIAGKASLSDAQKQAANIIRDAKKPSAIDNADAEQLDYHIKGYAVIDQYLKSFAYSGEVADAERKNKDVCGYIRLKNTNIDAPIMYGKDFYYHYHSWTGASSSNGSIYLYYDRPSKNSVITGHNLRKSRTMLHDLHTIQDKYAKSYSTYSNRLWTINLYGETHLYEVFSMYEEKPASANASSLYYNCNYNYTMDTMSDTAIRSWIKYQTTRTELNYTVDVDTSDRFITVVTCADLHSESEKGGRIYFFLRQVDGH